LLRAPIIAMRATLLAAGHLTSSILDRGSYSFSFKSFYLEMSRNL
jgi:hypothetical protein